MAISQAMLSVTPSPALTALFDKTIAGYRRSYPDEDLASLRDELVRASNEVNRITSEIYEALFDTGRKDEKIYFAVLKELNRIVLDESKKRKPLMRRILGGTLFNYETNLRSDRVEKCRENVSLAGMIILAKRIGKLNQLQP